MSKRGKKKKGKDQPAVKKLPVSEPRPLPSNFPGGLKVELLALFLILAAFAGLGFNASRQESVTVDEFEHLPTGLSTLKTHDFRLDPYNLPLTRMFAALPLLESGAKLSLKSGWEVRDYWAVALEFMQENKQSYQSLFLRGRAMILLLGLLLVAMTWWWGRALYGPRSGIFAATLTAFCPNIMAHSGLVTTDIGASLAFLATGFGFWQFCRKPTLGRGAGLGLLLGLALACKFTSLLLFPIMAGLGAAYFWRAGKGLNWKSMGRGVAVALIISWIVLNSAYLWKGAGTRISQYQFRSRKFTNLAKILPGPLPVPLPYDYVRGFDLQAAQNQRGNWSYLLGELSRKGWKYYFLAAMAVKMTLASLALILAALLAMVWFGKSWREELFLLIPAAAVIAAISMAVNLDFGIRYILPAIPFLYIFASRLVSPGGLGPGAGKWPGILAWGLLGSHLVSNLLIYPQYLAYFNFAAGGPEKGYQIMADSNIDWGQDLIRLKKYMDAEKLDDICLAYFGRVDPEIYGIRYQLPYPGVDCRLLAISVNFLVGRPYFTNDHGKFLEVKAGNFSSLRERKPIAAPGYSILVFDLHRAP